MHDSTPLSSRPPRPGLVETLFASLRRRLKVVAAAWAVGALLALLPALWLGVVAGGGFLVVPVAWCLVMLGPTAALVDSELAASALWPVRFGWAGLLLIPAHPLFPGRVGAWLTSLGMLLWFAAGWAVFLALARTG